MQLVYVCMFVCEIFFRKSAKIVKNKDICTASLHFSPQTCDIFFYTLKTDF